jgi:hypothetical protein
MLSQPHISDTLLLLLLLLYIHTGCASLCVAAGSGGLHLPSQQAAGGAPPLCRADGAGGGTQLHTGVCLCVCVCSRCLGLLGGGSGSKQLLSLLTAARAFLAIAHLALDVWPRGVGGVTSPLWSRWCRWRLTASHRCVFLVSGLQLLGGGGQCALSGSDENRLSAAA